MHTLYLHTPFPISSIRKQDLWILFKATLTLYLNKGKAIITVESLNQGSNHMSPLLCLP